MSFDACKHYQRNRDNVVKLRALRNEAYYEEAVFAALGLLAGQPGATMEAYKGAQDFLKHLSSLADDPVQPAPPISARIDHDTNYGNRRSKSSSRKSDAKA